MNVSSKVHSLISGMFTGSAAGSPPFACVRFYDSAVIPADKPR